MSKEHHNASTGPAKPHAPESPGGGEKPPRKPWPLVWVLLAILTYITAQLAYVVFFTD